MICVLCRSHFAALPAGELCPRCAALIPFPRTAARRVVAERFNLSAIAREATALGAPT